MIEGHGHDTPEAGPSGWSQPQRSRSNGDLRRRRLSSSSASDQVTSTSANVAKHGYTVSPLLKSLDTPCLSVGEVDSTSTE